MVDKITSPITPNEQANKINEIIDEMPAAQVNSDWNASSGVAQILNKPTIPTVNNATLTIQKNGTTVKTFTANASSNVTCNITVPTKTSDITNDSGYTSNVGTVTKVNNTSPDANGNVTLSIPAAQIQSDWNQTTTTAKDYIKNKPTIPSVGNATITITQGGTTKGSFTTNQSSNATIALDAGGGSTTTVKINGTSITSSGVADIKTNGTYNSSSNKIATMSDLPTVPTNVSSFTNDSGYITGINSTDVTTALGYTPESTSNKVTSISSSSTDTEYPSAKSVVELLKTIYPVGAIFIGTTATCPMSALFGTWELVAEDRCLQGSSTNHSANTTIAAGLPNIEGTTGSAYGRSASSGSTNATGCFTYSSGSNPLSTGSGTSHKPDFTGIDASRSNTIYGSSSTVQPPAYVVNVWRRTA